MKKLIFIMIFVLLNGTCLAQQKITVAYFNVPPFIMYDNEHHQLIGGALHEFLEQHMGPKMGVEFVWDKFPSAIPRQIISLETGAVDAIALLAWNPQRAGRFRFTKTPYFSSLPALAVLNKCPLNRVEQIEDILPLRIGYGKDAYLTSFMRDKRINFDLLASGNFNEQNFKKLLMARIDAVYAPDIVSLLVVVKKLNLEKEVAVIELPDKVSAFHLVFPQKAPAIARHYDQAFEQIDGQKLFLQILSKYVDTSKLKISSFREPSDHVKRIETVCVKIIQTDESPGSPGPALTPRPEAASHTPDIR